VNRIAMPVSPGAWARLLTAVATMACAALPAWAAAQPPAAAPAPAPIEVEYTQFTLPNGLHVILHEDHSVPMVTVNVWYHVGSAHEKPGRTGFAHLFEHLMFEGSANVEEGQFDLLLESAGGDNNGSTTRDRTNYWINVPSNALELALYLESDRMGYLLPAMSPESVDGQRDVVKNERRQSYENRPYGMASIELGHLLFPEGHPYRWPTIGYMEDLSAASYEDVVHFFETYYAPNNASLVVAGAIDSADTKRLVEKWFGEVPRGKPVPPIAPPAAVLTGVERKTISDKVQLPRLYLSWLTPAQFAPGDAALDIAAGILAGGKSSRLYERLVYDLQIAQDVAAYQQSANLVSTFHIVATARPGVEIDDIRKVVDEEIARLAGSPPSERELRQQVNRTEADFYSRLERVGGFGGKADLLNAYYVATGNPDFFGEDLARYRALMPSDIQAYVLRFLPVERRVELVVVPETADR
jgi:zinc protease